MGDDEQIRLLTEIKDAIKEHAAWEREYLRKQPRTRIMFFVMVIAITLVGIFVINQINRY